MTPWLLAAAGWLAAGALLARAIGCAVRIADDADDVWGCDDCAAEAEEQAALQQLAADRSRWNHPTNRRAREVAELDALYESS